MNSALKKIRMPNPFITLLLLLFAIAQVLYLGYDVASNDHSVEISFMKKFLDSSLYPNDPMVDTHKEFITFSTQILAFLSLIVPNIEVLFFLLQILAFFLIAAMIYYISLRLFDDKVSAIMAVIMIFPRKIALGTGAIHINMYVPTVAMLPVALFAIYLFLEERYTLSYAIIGLCLNYHALTSLYIFAMFTLYSVIYIRQIGVKRFAVSIGVFLLCASPVLIWMLFTISPMTAEWISLMRTRSSHHSFPFSWSKSHIFTYISFIALASISLFTTPERKYNSKILSFVLAIALMCGIGTIFAEIVPVKYVIKAQLFRSTKFLTLFMLIYLANYFRKSWSKSYIHKVAIVIGITALFFVSSYVAYIPLVLVLLLIAESSIEKRSSILWSVLAVVIFIISVLIVRTFVPHNPLPAVFKLDPIITFVRMPFENRWMFIVTCTALMLCSVKFIAKPIFRRIGMGLIAAIILLLIIPAVFRNFHPKDRNSSISWREAQFWAKDNTEKSDIFITPPYLTGFRIFSERPLVGEWKDGTQQYFKSEYGPVWWERMNDLGQGRDFDKLSLDQLKDLAGKYKAEYIVVPVARELELKLVHENNGYRIYEFPKELIEPAQK